MTTSTSAPGKPAEPTDVRHQPGESRFVIAGADGHQAVLEYRLDPGAVVFTHTFVPPAQRGGGVAARLVDAGLEWAKAEGRTPRAECSYVAAVLQRRGL